MTENKSVTYTPGCARCDQCCDACDDHTTAVVGYPLEWYNDVDCEYGVDLSSVCVGVAAIVGGVIGALAYKVLHKN